MLADLLVSQLSRPATTRERFRLPFSKTDTVRVLLAGVKAEVERRDKTFVMSDALLTQTEQIAEWLTGYHSKSDLCCAADAATAALVGLSLIHI